MNQEITIHHDLEDKQFYVSIDGSRAYLAYMDLGRKTLDIYRERLYIKYGARSGTDLVRILMEERH